MFFASVTQIQLLIELAGSRSRVQTVNDCWRLLLQRLEELWEHVELVACNKPSCEWHHKQKLVLVALVHSLLDVVLGRFYRLPVHALLSRLCEVNDLVDCKKKAKFPTV